MSDSIRASWLRQQFQESMTFAQHSDVLSLAPVAGEPPYKYIARFRCNGLCKTDARIAVIDEHLVGILFPEHYLRSSCDPGQVLTWLEPDSEFHPNIRPPYCCVGHIAPGMSLLSLLHQLYQMITWQRFTAREDDALNKLACSWARKHLDRFPIDPRRSMLQRQEAPSANAGGANQ
ncbi:hypothetical protein N8198_05690 [Gammaproteobacteria bacterium]|nr:hypothetical protein [Gammaproteobacteria bacterium]